MFGNQPGAGKFEQRQEGSVTIDTTKAKQKKKSHTDSGEFTDYEEIK